MNNTWSLKGKLALITGATKGIGKAIAHEFSELAADLILVARSYEDLEECKAELMQHNTTNKIITVVADVSQVEGREAIYKVLHEEGARLDVLVNNVGTTIRKKLDEYEKFEYEHIINVNIFSLMEMMRLSFDFLKEGNNPSVINIASVAGLVDISSGAPYGLSKAAVIQLGRHMAVEWAPDGIRVNTISPWYTDTPLAAPVLGDP